MCQNHIKNMKEAKKYFIALGCSHFHMGREYPERYCEYRELEIPSEIEEQWRSNTIIQKLRQLEQTDDDRSIYHLVSYMETAISGSNNSDHFELFRKAIQMKQNTVDSFTKLLFSEMLKRIIGNYKNDYTDTLSELNPLSYEIAKDVISKPVELSDSTLNDADLCKFGAADTINILRRAQNIVEEHRR